MTTRHASRTSVQHLTLCGRNVPSDGRITQPGETVNCPACRMILNHLRQQYPENWDYQDTRPTPAQAKAAAAGMVADMQGGAND